MYSVLLSYSSCCLCVSVSVCDLREEGHQKLLDLRGKGRRSWYLGNTALGCYGNSSLSSITTAVANTEVSCWKRAVRQI